MRLDKYIQEKFALRSRTYAENLILTGRVFVGGREVNKPSFDVDDEREVKILADEGYASQGAYKLEKGLTVFGIDVEELTCADIGCSNGGFTDVLLRHGAASVLAVDVGECALPKAILEDVRVKFLKANARALPRDLDKVDFACTDVSFISLKLILGELYALLKDGGSAIVLVKPQFEAGASALNKSGIVKSDASRRGAVDGVKKFAESVGFTVAGEDTAPIRYADKNIEYLLYLKKNA